MKFLNKNKELLKQYREELYYELFAERESAFEDMVYSSEAKDGNVILTVEKNGIKYRLNSSYYPKIEAELWIQQFNFNHINKVISVFGFGSSWTIKELIKKIEKNELILIYEPSINIFLSALENIDLEDIITNKQVIITIVGINEIKFHDKLRDSVEWLNLYSQIICCTPQYEKIYKEEYRDFLRVIRDNNNRSIVNINTEATLGKESSKNIIKNLRYLKESNIVSDLRGIISDYPAIIVAAGPSLDKNVEELSKAKGKSIIIATDTSVNRLLAYDIIPDLTITLDPIKPTKHYKDERVKNIPIMYHFPSNNEIISEHKGRKFLFNKNIYLLKMLQHYSKKAYFNNSGGSVATAAYSACMIIGFKRIIMVGQDLAFSGNITHAGGVVANEKQMNMETIMVEDIYGNMIPSPINFYTFLQWFNDAIAVSEGVDVIDATEGGAKIKGTAIMDLKDAIEQYCVKKVNLNVILDTLEPTFNDKEFLMLKELMVQSKNELELIINKAKSTIISLEKLVLLSKHQDDKKLNSLLKKISKNDKWIEKCMVYRMLEEYISDTLAKTLNRISNVSDDNAIDIYNKAIETYRALIEGAKELKSLMEEEITKAFN